MSTVVEVETRISSRSMAVLRTGALWIPRQGIRWSGGIAGKPLKIEFLVENRGTEPSTPRPVRIDVAPFGAFVPWRPLTRLDLPGIPPGGRVVMTATAGDDELPQTTDLLGRGRADLRRPRYSTMFSTLLSAMRVLQRRSTALKDAHYVGNLDVHVRGCEPVERHVQEAVGLQAGTENWSMFMIGDGSDDRYTLRLEAGPGWRVNFEPGNWDTPMHGPVHCIIVTFVPPAEAERGHVAIWVRRDSTGQEVPVEFELVAEVPEARCYRR